MKFKSILSVSFSNNKLLNIYNVNNNYYYYTNNSNYYYNKVNNVFSNHHSNINK
jgi:hypothetical protein